MLGVFFFFPENTFDTKLCRGQCKCVGIPDKVLSVLSVPLGYLARYLPTGTDLDVDITLHTSPSSWIMNSTLGSRLVTYGTLYSFM